MRVLRATWALLGLTLLGAAALAGVTLSGASLWASTPAGRERVAALAVGLIDRELAGRLELAGVEVLQSGGVEIRGLRVFDPDERLVLQVDRARVEADVTRLRGRVVALSVELDAPSILVEEEADGGISLLRALAPTTPAAADTPASPPAFTIRVSRLTVRGGNLWWRGASGGTRLEARELSVDARGGYGPDEADLDLRLGAAMEVPVVAPLSLEVKGTRRREALAVPVLRLALGSSAFSAVGEGDLSRRTGRAAVTRLAIDRSQVRAFAPAAGGGEDVGAHAYAESDGRVVTAAADVAPAGGDGSMRAAGAARLADLAGGTPAFGFDAALSALDPSRLLAGLPPGAITLTARGGAVGTKLPELRGRLEGQLARSTLRGVALGPGEVRARADRGTVEVQKVALTGPGFTVEGNGRWGRRAAVAGRLVLEASDLAELSRAAGRLTGQPTTPAAGALRLEATVSGTEQAPAVEATLSSAACSLADVSLRQLAGRLQAVGPTRAPGVEVELRAEAIRVGGEERAQRAVLEGALREGAATLTASASVPSLGTSAVSLSAGARLGERNETLLVSDLTLGWPGERWALTGPARLTFAGPSLDRLELASGDQRLALAGAVAGRTLDVLVTTSRLDLSRLPRGVLPGGTSGRVSLEARATGGLARPDARVTFSLEEGATTWLTGLRAAGEAGWDGRRRRARVALELARRAGGRLEVTGEVPVPLAARPGEDLALRVKAEDLPLAEALLGAGFDLPLDGRVGIEAQLSGTAGGPSLTAAATLGDGAWDDLYPVDLDVSAEAPGDRLRVKGGFSVDGRRALTLDAEVPFDLGDALAHPEAVADAVRAARLQATAEVPALDLTAVAGAVGVPRDLAGVLHARAEVSGTLSAPRGELRASVAQLEVAGHRDLSGRVEAKVLADRVELTAGSSMGGIELLRVSGSLSGAPERLLSAGTLAAAPIQLVAEVPGVDLARVVTPLVSLAGTLDARVEAQGTPGRPVLRARLEGAGLAVEGRSLGALAVTAGYADGKGSAEGTLRPTSGGAISASGTLTASLGLGRETDLGAAPLDGRMVADALDLGFIPAIAPGVVREAQGKLTGEVRTRGTLMRPRPSGHLEVEGARLAVAEYGEWTGIALDLQVDDDALELRRLEGRRGKGRFEGRGSVRGLAGAEAAVVATARFTSLTVARAGMDLATLDLAMSATGTLRPSTGLDLEVKIPGGNIGLPRRVPRTLQTLERRADIVVGKIRERRRPPRVAPRPETSEGRTGPFRWSVRTVVPGKLVVKGDEPHANVELKADVTYELAGAEESATGDVEVVRGFVEPIGGRVFDLTRGRVQFTGGPPTAAMVDVEARWASPEGTQVTVLVTGPALDPKIKLSSQPPLDDAQIALLIATGRTELKRGSGEVGALSTQDAGYAAASAVVTTAFKSLLADKLPIDSISLDASSLRAGKYLPNSRIYVGYVYRFEADLQRGQNQNEVSVEYQINPRWTMESRYGDGQTGSASLIWSRDY
jgi:translocation and assembly module TamB